MELAASARSCEDERSHNVNKAHLRALLGSCSLMAMLLVAAPACALIVVNKSIDGVKLGVTTSTVRRLLGRPQSTAKCSVLTVCSPVPGASPGTVSWTYGSSQRQNKSYVFIKGRVAFMATFSASDRTAAGVGPATSLKVAKQRYPQFAFHHFLPGQQPRFRLL
jgi:hypothetical protein